MMDGLIQLCAVLCLFGWIPITVIYKYQIRLIQIKQRSGVSDETVTRALNEVRHELQSLRDTTTKFDMSFDAALTRIEQRVDTLEHRSYESAETPVVLNHR